MRTLQKELIKIYKLNKLKASEKERILRRSSSLNKTILDYVKPFVYQVRKHGDQAISDYIKEFDKVTISPSEFEVDLEKVNKVDKKFIVALDKQISACQKYQKQILKNQKDWEIEIQPGVCVGQKSVPLESVGIYIPGGTASYPSTLQMLATTAKTAGVKRIVACCPTNKLTGEIIATAQKTGVTQLYRIGGVAAIAALAYGTKTIKKVDKIIGPGNIFVTAAKILVSQDTAIDMPAGPTEVIIIADKYANPKFIAADLLAQAEHDANASVVLITWDYKLAQKTQNEVNKQVTKLTRKDIVCKSLEKYSCIIMVDNLNQAIDFTNKFAPEHLEIMTKKPLNIFSKIKNSGSVFLGSYTPVAAGDYATGTNHVLPTSGWAKVYSAVSVLNFMKFIQYQKLTRNGLSSLYDTIGKFARVEKLDAHFRSAEIRLTENG